MHQLKKAGRERVLAFDKKKITLQWLTLVEQIENSSRGKGQM